MAENEHYIRPQPEWTVAEARERIEEYGESISDGRRRLISGMLLIALLDAPADATLEDVVRRLCANRDVISVAGDCHCPECGAMSERLLGLAYCYQCDLVFSEGSHD